MKKKLVAAMMAAVMTIGLLAGCGGGSDASTGNDTGAESDAPAEDTTPDEPQQAEVAEATIEDVTIKVALWDYSSTCL